MAEIKVSCVGCGQRIQLDENYSGQQIRCPQCQAAFIVPPMALPNTQQKRSWFAPLIIATLLIAGLATFLIMPKMKSARVMPPHDAPASRIEQAAKSDWNKDSDDPMASGNFQVAINKLQDSSVSLKSLARETGVNDAATMAQSPKSYIGQVYAISGVVYWVERDTNSLSVIKAFWLDEKQHKTDIWYMGPDSDAFDGFKNGDFVNLYGYFVGKGKEDGSIMLVGNSAVLLQKADK